MPLRDLCATRRGIEECYSFLPMWAYLTLRHLNRELPQEYRGFFHRTRGVFADPPCEDEFALRIVTADEEERLVASVEFVTPANKARSESRAAFAAHCLDLLRREVCVSVVDVVTTHSFDLHAEIMTALGQNETSAVAHSPTAATFFPRPQDGGKQVDVCAHQLHIGLPLPTLPMFVAEVVCLPLDLEPTFEEAWDTLRQPE